MTKTLEILEIVAMGVCIGFVLICWGADLGRVGNMHPGVRFDLLFHTGLATSVVGFIVSLIAYHRRPALARVSLLACLSWIVWSILPRL
jgi:hypothetical protein